MQNRVDSLFAESKLTFQVALETRRAHAGVVAEELADKTRWKNQLCREVSDGKAIEELCQSSRRAMVEGSTKVR